MFLQSSHPPDLETQRDAYLEVIGKIKGHPVTIRTLNLGGDKKAPFLLPHFEANPNLGLRGLRFSLARSDLFHTQLEAVIQSIKKGDHVRVLFPMVLGASDLKKALGILKGIRKRMKKDHPIECGAMIETPSSLFELDEILELSDFLSIGTNDILQFMLAADRNASGLLNEESLLQPSVLRAISKIVEASWDKGIPVCVCGEHAGNPRIACLLVGLGIRELSMSPVRATLVRYAFCNNTLSDLEGLTDAVIKSSSPKRISSLLNQFFERNTVKG